MVVDLDVSTVSPLPVLARVAGRRARRVCVLFVGFYREEPNRRTWSGDSRLEEGLVHMRPARVHGCHCYSVSDSMQSPQFNAPTRLIHLSCRFLPARASL